LLIEFTPTDWLIGIGLLVILLPFLWQRKHSLAYLVFFSIFWLYLLAVVQAVVFPFAVGTSVSPAVFRPSLNLIPFYFGDCPAAPAFCARMTLESILDNILLTLPFGFGINFIRKVRPKAFLWLAPAVGCGCELAQLIISLVFKSGFRAVDINDAIFNTIGVLLGYALFRAFAWLFLQGTARLTLSPRSLWSEIRTVALRAESFKK